MQISLETLSYNTAACARVIPARTALAERFQLRGTQNKMFHENAIIMKMQIKRINDLDQFF